MMMLTLLSTDEGQAKLSVIHDYFGSQGKGQDVFDANDYSREYHPDGKDLSTIFRRGKEPESYEQS